jgi:hypothetical protein
MSTPREPLSAQERALAQRLARAAGAHEPGPALDARILAAARAAVDEAAQAAAPASEVTAPRATPSPRLPPSQARRRDRRRWTLGFGVAASLLLAVTVAWQLRPQHTRRLVHESAQAPAAPQAVTEVPVPAAADRAEPVGTASAPAPGPVREDPAASAPRAAPAPSAKPEQIGLPPPSTPKALSPEPAQRRERYPAGPQAVAPAVPAAQQDAVAPAAQAEPPRAASLAPPPAAPPAPVVEAGAAPPPPAPSDPMPALEGPVDRPDAQRVMAETPETARADHLQDDPGAGNRESAPALATGGDNPAALQSAIAQDQGLPAQAWLQRIRTHRLEGNGALARASLQAFRQAHPDAPIPEDLRALLP